VDAGVEEERASLAFSLCLPGSARVVLLAGLGESACGEWKERKIRAKTEPGSWVEARVRTREENEVERSVKGRSNVSKCLIRKRERIGGERELMR
jgi:hypothetical protein